MKVIKRDGRAVDFDKKKIEIAIEKANKEVKNEEQAKKKDINKIVKSIENIDKKRILVEDIQDIIEEKLMELGKFNLAKKYIVYRYTRALVRKQNTTDESILGIIKNQGNINSSNNSNYMLAKFQRNLIAGEVSKDLTKRMLLPEKIIKAIDNGIIYFHNADYFLQPMIVSSFINIKDILENNIKINNQEVECPKDFLDACTKTVEILANLASCQIGELNIDLRYLAYYLKISKEKIKKRFNKLNIEKNLKNDIINIILDNEVENGIKYLFNINIANTVNGLFPNVSFILYVDNDKENVKIIEKIIDFKKRYNYKYPQLIYVLNEFNLNNNNFEHLTKEVLKIKNINLLSEKVSFDYYKYLNLPLGNRCFLKSLKNKDGGKFNQGIVSINLVQIGLAVKNDRKKLYEEIDKRMELCFESLMCYYYSLTNTISNISPLHYIYGGISKLENNEYINKLLKKDYSSLYLNYVGLQEMINIIVDENTKENEKLELSLNIVSYLKNILKKWQEETGIQFNLYEDESQKANEYFYEIDKEIYPAKLKKISLYSTTFKKSFKTIKEQLEYEKLFSKIHKGNTTSHLNLDNLNEDEKKEIIDYIYKNILYAQIN